MVQTMDSQKHTNLVESFFEIPPPGRITFLMDYFLASRDDVHSVWNILDVYSADADSFQSAVSSVLERDKNNIPARRASVWLHIRLGLYREAESDLLHLVDMLPTAIVERRELLRVGFIFPALLTLRNCEIGMLGVDTKLSEASYSYQIARAKRLPETPVEATRLRNVLAEAGASIKTRIMERLAVEPRLHPGLARLMQALDSAGRIALVGNGPSLRGSKRGLEIDRYDFIIRCNFPVIAGFAQDVGSRTDAVFFTEALYRLFEMYLDRDPCYRSVLLISLGNPAAAGGLDPDEVAASSRTNMARIPELSLDVMKDMTYRHLTTGAQAYLLLAALFGKQITLFGFDFYGEKELHYFSQNTGLWLAHEVQYEEFLFKSVVKSICGAYIR